MNVEFMNFDIAIIVAVADSNNIAITPIKIALSSLSLCVFFMSTAKYADNAVGIVNNMAKRRYFIGGGFYVDLYIKSACNWARNMCFLWFVDILIYNYQCFVL